MALREELLCKRAARGRTAAQAVVKMDWVVESCFMMDVLIERLKRGFVMAFFLGAAIWLTWCGERYDDRHNSTLPVILCAVESIVLVITGVGIALKRTETELEE